MIGHLSQRKKIDSIKHEHTQSFGLSCWFRRCLTVGPSVLLPLHLLLVLLQLLVGQLVKGVRRFWSRWHLWLVDWGLVQSHRVS